MTAWVNYIFKNECPYKTKSLNFKEQEANGLTAERDRAQILLANAARNKLTDSAGCAHPQPVQAVLPLHGIRLLLLR